MGSGRSERTSGAAYRVLLVKLMFLGSGNVQKDSELDALSSFKVLFEDRNDPKLSLYIYSFLFFDQTEIIGFVWFFCTLGLLDLYALKSHSGPWQMIYKHPGLLA